MDDAKQLSIGDDIRTLDNAQKQALYESIRAVENMEEEIADIRADCNERKTLIRETYGISGDVLAFVLKRRKKKPDERSSFDDVVTLIEEYLADAEGENRDDVRQRIDEAVKNGLGESELSEEIPETA